MRRLTPWEGLALAVVLGLVLWALFLAILVSAIRAF